MMSGDAMNAGVRYSRDRPKSCEFCYYWKGRPAGCSLGEQNCFYIIHDEKNIKDKTGRCDGCPYGKHAPCIGWCTVEVMNAVLGGNRAGQNSRKQEVV
ncbi:MAG: hypothetical protein LUC90_03135 [Lachnospiraceae bacterium]|nr:hypothetical protein [Lachnospiraceae bacterium]